MPEIGLNYYPFSTPIVLTDVLFEEYGGNAANTSKSQRQAAYWLAEMKASEDIGSLLAKTVITGTYHYANRVMVEHSNVHRVILTRFVDFEENIYHTVSGTANVYIGLEDSKRGIIDIAGVISKCQCAAPGWINYRPYQMQIVYEAGLPSGTVYMHDVLLGLTTYAQIMLNEVVGYGNEAPGDATITEYSNQEYSEKRKGLINTAFGGSPKANFAHKLFTRLREYRWVSL